MNWFILFNQYDFFFNQHHDQTITVGRTVFNQNSIDFLNNAQHKNFENFERLLAQYQYWLETYDYDQDGLCLTDQSVLAAYGIRDCTNLQFLYQYDSDAPKLLISTNSFTGTIFIENYEQYKDYYPIHKHDIIFNPEHHFYYRGIRFATLDVITEMKKQRQSENDLLDLQLIL